MTVFTATINQTAFLFLFILAGYLLTRLKLVPHVLACVTIPVIFALFR